MGLIDLLGPRQACVLLVSAALMAGCHSEDKADWEPLADQKVYVSDRLYDVAMLSPEHALIVGYAGKVLETTNSGLTWNLIDAGTDNALYSIDFANDSVGWIVGQEASILKTTDGGKTWQQQAGDIYMTDECRDTNGESDENCAFAPFFAASVVDANTVIAIGDRSTVAITKDGGQTWNTQTLRQEGIDELDQNSLLAFEDPVLYDVQFFDADNGFVVGEFGKIFKTTDGGVTWYEKQASLVGDLYFDILDLPTFFDIEFLNRQVGYAVGLEGRVAKTSDGGETWDWLDHGVEAYDSPFYSAAVLPNGKVWVVGASGQIVYSEDGTKFGQGSLGTAVNNWIRTVRFYDNDHGWVIGGFGFIMSTSDGGKTWFRRIG